MKLFAKGCSRWPDVEGASASSFVVRLAERLNRKWTARELEGASLTVTIPVRNGGLQSLGCAHPRR